MMIVTCPLIKIPGAFFLGARQQHYFVAIGFGRYFLSKIKAFTSIALASKVMMSNDIFDQGVGAQSSREIGNDGANTRRNNLSVKHFDNNMVVWIFYHPLPDFL